MTKLVAKTDVYNNKTKCTGAANEQWSVKFWQVSLVFFIRCKCPQKGATSQADQCFH